MSATLRTGAIHRRRKRLEKRRKLRRLLEHASGAERAALEAKLVKTYLAACAPPPPLASPESHAKAPRASRSTG